MKGWWESNIKCLVPIYVFPEMKLRGQKQNYNVLSPNFHIHVSVNDLYIPRIFMYQLAIIYSQDQSAYFAAAI